MRHPALDARRWQRVDGHGGGPAGELRVGRLPRALHEDEQRRGAGGVEIAHQFLAHLGGLAELPEPADHDRACGREQRRRVDEGVERFGIEVGGAARGRSEEHTSELQSQSNLVCRLLLEKKKKKKKTKLASAANTT